MSSDGKTSHERWKGKKFRRTLAEFGERVMYLKSGSKGVNKWDSRWSEGIFLGLRDESGEIIIGTEEGCVKARDFKRLSDENERWDAVKFNKMRGSPWEPVPGRGSTELRVNVHIPTSSEEPIPHETGREGGVHRFRIMRDDIKRFGLMPMCPGCTAVNRGEPAQSHSEACRKKGLKSS